MQHINPHNLAHLKYITLLNVKVLRLIHENKLNWAKPISRNVCIYPVKYENVLIGEYVNKNASGSIDSKESYYLNIFNIFGSINLKKNFE